MNYEETLTNLKAELGAFIIVFGIILIAVIVWQIIGRWKLYVKAGQPGWKSIIPFYSTYTLVEMVGLNWYWFLLAIAPNIISVLNNDALSYVGDIASLFANIMIFYNMSKKIHQNTGWVVFAVIFSGLAVPVSGYSKKVTWDKDAVVTPNAFFDKKQQ